MRVRAELMIDTEDAILIRRTILGEEPHPVVTDSNLILLLRCRWPRPRAVVFRYARFDRRSPGNQDLVLVVGRNHRHFSTIALRGIVGNRDWCEINQVAAFVFTLSVLAFTVAALAGDQILRRKEGSHCRR